MLSDVCYATESDINSWMNMIALIKDNFPGLETSEQLKSYQETVLKNIRRETALCIKEGENIVAILIFSYKVSCLSCMAVHPDYRGLGLASKLVEKMLSLFPEDQDISVSTFRDNDPKGDAPRVLYKKFGFVEDELIVEFDYPHQRFILKR
ncbi:MAG: GNAT family N-acetyltransferase [Clostridiales bacterium]|nr:GNAT family N-acetyltransferase [Clostridiales bacterium]